MSSLHSSELGEVIGYFLFGRDVAAVRGVVCRQETRWVRNVFDPEGWLMQEYKARRTVPPFRKVPLFTLSDNRDTKDRPADMTSTKLGLLRPHAQRQPIDISKVFAPRINHRFVKEAVVEHPKREQQKEPITPWYGPPLSVPAPLARIPVPPLQKEIYKVCGQTRTLVWKQPTLQLRQQDAETCKHDKLLIPSALCQTKPRFPQSKPRFVGIGPQDFHASWFTDEQQRQAPTFTVVPKHAPYKKPSFVNGKRRLGKSYLCPHCCQYVVVGYRTYQVGRPLWSVPMWDTANVKMLLYELLGATPTWKLEVTAPVLLNVDLEANDYPTIGCNLGEAEVIVPVIERVRNVFHRDGEPHSVGYGLSQIGDGDFCLKGETADGEPAIARVIGIFKSFVPKAIAHVEPRRRTRTGKTPWEIHEHNRGTLEQLEETDIMGNNSRQVTLSKTPIGYASGMPEKKKRKLLTGLGVVKAKGATA